MIWLNKVGREVAVGSSGGEPTARTQGWFEQLRGPEARRGKSSRRSEMSAEDIAGVGVEVEPGGGLSEQSSITPNPLLNNVDNNTNNDNC